MIAPLPALDSIESPLIFVATIFAKMLEPYGKLNGAATKLATAITH